MAVQTSFRFQSGSQLESSLAVARRIARRVGRETLTEDEREDFTSFVVLELLDDDCRRIRRYRGEGSLDAYLTTVVKRLLLEFRIRRWGRWRPSQRALSLGPRAERLEALVYRDGLSLAEAEGMVTTEFPNETTPVRELILELPVRPPRREIPVDPEAVSSLGDSVDTAESRECEGLLCRLAEELDRIFDDLGDDERELLRLRFEEHTPVSQLARSERGQQRLYRETRRLVRKLRAELESSGVSGADVLHALRVVGPAIDVPFARSRLQTRTA